MNIKSPPRNQTFQPSADIECDPIDGGMAIQYCGSPSPVTQGTTVAFSEQHTSPGEGTA